MTFFRSLLLQKYFTSRSGALIDANLQPGRLWLEIRRATVNLRLHLLCPLNACVLYLGGCKSQCVILPGDRLLVEVEDAQTERGSSKNPLTRIPLSLVLGLSGTIILDTLAELLWKAGVISAHCGDDFFQLACAVIVQPLFIAAMLLFIPKYFNWMFVLSRADFSFAKPITSLSYVTVLIFSALFLHESVTPAKLIGLSLVLAGVWLVCRTETHTVAGDSK